MKIWVYVAFPQACRMIAVLLETLLTHAQLTNFHRLHSFGDVSQTGTKPMAGVIIGRDGWLYGTSSEGGTGRQGVVFKINPDGSGYRVLHHFRGGTNDGARPEAELLEGTDGLLYGTTPSGGSYASGTVFRMNKGGSGFEVLHGFGATGDGALPGAAVIEGSDDKLYGTTPAGGTGGRGAVFRINKDGTGYSLLHSFASNELEGTLPTGSLVEAGDGWLYGVASRRGTNGTASRGTLFKVNKDGSGFAILRSFQGQPTEPAEVRAGLIAGRDGLLYGVSAQGGLSDLGCIFSFNPEMQELKVLRHFTSDPDGRPALESLMEGQDGALYGTAISGGTNGYGTVFRIQRDGSNYVVLHHFAPGGGGNTPRCKLVQGASGELFGATESGGWPNWGTLFATQTNGTNHRILWSFFFGGGDAQSPSAPLVEGPDGLLYGTGSLGGAGGSAGAIFKIRKDSTGYNIVRHFGLTPGDGSGLTAGVIVGRDGKLYGATEGGGTNGVGTVYKIDRDGTGYQILRHFRVGTDGQYPYSPLLQASDGFLYGVTRGQTDGTIFKLGTNGAGFITLRYLYGPAEGADPHFPLIEGSDGFLYGTTPVGGLSGGGTIFRIRRDGSSFTVLRHFSNGPGQPHTILAALFEGSDGMLYGTTSSGGLERGTVFKINKDGTGYQVLHNFTAISRTLWPFSSLVEGRDNALYGVTFTGITNDFGAVYKLNRDGSGFSLVHAFDGINGDHSRAPLLMASDGAFYGTTLYGGHLGLGTLFRIGHQLSLVKTNNTVQLQLTGVPGYTYTLRRSADLRTWSAWSSATIPTTTRLHFSDASPPANAGFYSVSP